jgi:hypothetical protein
MLGLDYLKKKEEKKKKERWAILDVVLEEAAKNSMD